MRMCVRIRWSPELRQDLWHLFFKLGVRARTGTQAQPALFYTRGELTPVSIPYIEEDRRVSREFG